MEIKMKKITLSKEIEVKGEYDVIALGAVKYPAVLGAHVCDLDAAEHARVRVLTAALGKEGGAVKLDVKEAVDLGAIDDSCLKSRQKSVGFV